VTDTSWNYPTLGFDPLPGDPAVALALKEDARVFGQRMTEEATRLERLAHQGWQGEAAEAFAEHLKTLPRDLRHCGEAFTDLALALGNYHDAFTLAKTQAADLETRAAAAKAKLQTAEMAYTTPIIQAPDACPPDRDRGPLDAAEDELGQILRDAHEFAERFNESAEVGAIGDAIRRFTEFAPDEPRWNIIKKWAGDVFQATPIGAAVTAAHDLINSHAEFFSDLADFVSDVSGVIGLLSLPLLLVPPLGPAVALAAFATAAGSASIKASLYVGKARDADGNLYVSGGELLRATGDVAINAVGIGATAGANLAADGVQITAKSFGREFGEQFSGVVVRDAARTGKSLVGIHKQLRTAGLAKYLGTSTAQHWAAKEGADLGLSITGVGLTIGAPLATATAPMNLAGWRSLQSLPADTAKLLCDASDVPDLQVRPQPVVIEASTPRPVMGR
jgi:uncharacterized protein YukE